MGRLNRLFALNCLLLVPLACSGDKSDDHPTVEETAWRKIRIGALLVDVRTPAEYARGHIEGAMNIPYDQIEARTGELGDDKNREIVLYCRSGRRSALAKQTLEKLGFTHVFNAGSYQRLLEAR